MTMARALWWVDAGRAELRDEPLDVLGPQDVRVKARFSGVSRGTESLVAAGKVPASLHDTMRAPFQTGHFPFPVKYGYCSVGTIEAGPLAPGTPVFALFPHQDRYVVPRSAVHPLPEGLPSARAVLAANLETALNVVWDGTIGPADHVAVIGAGVVGSLVAWLAGRIPGTRVTLVDINPERAPLAAALGVDFATPEQAPGDRDVVVEASGSPGGLATALGLAGVEATVVVASWYGVGAVPVPLGEAFHSRRLTLRSSQVGRVPPVRAPRFDFRRRLAAALSLLAEAPELDALIDAEVPFEASPTVVPRITRPGAQSLCLRISY